MKTNKDVATILSILAAILLTGAAVLLTHDSIATAASGAKTGAAEYGTGSAPQPTAERAKAIEDGKKPLPGHAGFCSQKARTAREPMGKGRGQVVAKTPARGHGGFLAPGEEC